MADTDVEVRPLEAPQVPDGTAVPDAPGADPSQATGPINPAQFIRDAQQNLGIWQQKGVQTMAEMQAAQQQMMKQQQEAMQRRGPMYDQLQQEMSRPALTPEQQADMMRPAQMPQVPDKPAVDPQEFKNFFGMAMIMTAVLGRFMGADMNQGITALAQAMTGFKTGATEKANQQMAIYKEKFEAAMNAQREKLLRYKQIIDARNSSIQDKMNLLKIEAARSDDQQALFALQQNNYKMLLEYINKQETQWRQMVTQGVKMYDDAAKESGRMARAQMRQDEADAKLKRQDEWHKAAIAIQNARLEWSMEQKQNAVLDVYRKGFNDIQQRFLQTITKMQRTPGMTPESLEVARQAAAEVAAASVQELNSELLEQTIDGEHFSFAKAPEAALKAQDPNYWMAISKGFAGLKSYQYVPPLGTERNSMYPSGGQPAQPPAVGATPPQGGAAPAPVDPSGVQWDDAH